MTHPSRKAAERPQYAPLALSAAAILSLATASGAYGLKAVALLVLGALLGGVLLYASFSFAGAYRRMLLRREFDGVRAQLVMVALANLLFGVTFASAQPLGLSVVGAVAPVGLQAMFGSFLFGVGMQLGGGCGSGTLFALGGGSLRMALTLVAMCGGAFLGSEHLDWWRRLPSSPPISLGDALGWAAACSVQVGLLLLLWLVLGGRPPRGVADLRRAAADVRVRRLYLAAMALAVLNWLTLLVAGHPWSITWGFTLWGAKAAAAMGWEASASSFWDAGFPARALSGGLLEDTTSLMDLGLIAGAAFVAAAAGRFKLNPRMAPAVALAAVLGGFAMGYGARLSYGCNIGAFVSGVASTSLHGWLWLVCALPGAYVGAKLRPRFGLAD